MRKTFDLMTCQNSIFKYQNTKIQNLYSIDRDVLGLYGHALTAKKSY